MRTLVLQHQGAPLLISVTPGPIRARILEMPDDDAELFDVWEVPADDSHRPAANITEQFALTWATEFRFSDGIEPHDYLAPFPAFIREAARDKLIRMWQRRMAETDKSFIPDVRMRA